MHTRGAFNECGQREADSDAVRNEETSVPIPLSTEVVEADAKRRSFADGQWCSAAQVK